MINFDQARQIALNHIGPDCGLINELILEKPYGWYFMYQSKDYLESGNFLDMLCGTGGFIVEREDGQIFEFGSALSTDEWMANYEKGFKYEAYDLHVTGIKDARKTERLLCKLDMTYVIPELAHGVEWKIPQPYTQKKIREALRKLPCIFENQAFWHRIDVFDAISASGCCTYEVMEYRR